MKAKKSSRKVLLIVYFVAICSMILRFIMGKADVLYVVSYITYDSILMIGILWLENIREANKDYKTYKDAYDYLETVHRARYRLYFEGDEEKIEAYSKEIESYGKRLIELCEDSLKIKGLSKGMYSRIQKIIDQTKKLMTTIQT